MHVINRQWFPEPTKEPLKTLEWIYRWNKLHKGSIRPELDANLQYIKALALWQVFISPLAKDANMVILKAWGCWPVHSALEEALDTGFSKASPSLKNNVALLGYHYEYFSHAFETHAKLSKRKNRWYTYLRGRGISQKEAWCPR